MDLTRQSGTLAAFNKSDMQAVLVNGTNVLFRSADDPDRLRGPNLGWFYMDEGALSEEIVWLIMIGRLREQPGRGWISTTPAGHNWLYDVFVKNADENYAIIQAPTTSNPFLPPGFVESLKAAYPDEWQLQEIDGQFVQTAGALFKRAWFQVVEKAPEGLRWSRYWDLAASIKTTADFTASAALALGEDGAVYVRDMVRGRWEWPDAKKIIMQTMLAEPGTQHGIEEALNGLSMVQELHRERSIVHVSLKGIRVDRDKVSRALPVAARAEQGKLKLVAGPWINSLLDELISFPHGKHDDQVDTLSGGLQMLSKPLGGKFFSW
jgi:predicted phage terminase large subunit-like protein